jgi:adhesin transport system membrane fusion protein
MGVREMLSSLRSGLAALRQQGTVDTVTHDPMAKREKRLLYWILGVLGVLLVWAAIAPIDKIVRAEGRIIAAAKAQIVQHLEGGIVSEILIREGQSVAAGQVLMRLSDVQANSEVRQGVTRLQALLAMQARLDAEASGAATVTFPEDVDVEQKQLELNAFAERVRRIDSEQSVLKQQIIQRQTEMREAQSRAKNLEIELDLARKQMTVLENLRAKGVASELELLDAQAKTQRLVSNYGDVQSSIPRLRAGIDEMNSRLAESLAGYRSDARAELAKINADIRRMTLAVDGDSDKLARTEVRAPVSGFINRLNFNTIGGVIKPGEPLMEITPSEGPLAVEARVRPDDRATLRSGLTTKVMIGAYDYAVYGTLDGHLVDVSADTLQDEQGGRYYRVLIETEQAQGALAGQVIMPGMTARADVVVGQRSVLSYVLSPLFKFSSQAMREAR